MYCCDTEAGRPSWACAATQSANHATRAARNTLHGHAPSPVITATAELPPLLEMIETPMVLYCAAVLPVKLWGVWSVAAVTADPVIETCVEAACTTATWHPAASVAGIVMTALAPVM